MGRKIRKWFVINEREVGLDGTTEILIIGKKWSIIVWLQQSNTDTEREINEWRLWFFVEWTWCNQERLWWIERSFD